MSPASSVTKESSAPVVRVSVDSDWVLPITRMGIYDEGAVASCAGT